MRSAQYRDVWARDGARFSPTSTSCPRRPSERVMASAARLAPSVTRTFTASLVAACWRSSSRRVVHVEPPARHVEELVDPRALAQHVVGPFDRVHLVAVPHPG